MSDQKTIFRGQCPDVGEILNEVDAKGLPTGKQFKVTVSDNTGFNVQPIADAGKTKLPKYAFPYAHPAAQRGDVGAEFRADDGMTICVSIEQCDEGMFTLDIPRGGIGENLFTRGELAKVLELAGILLAANGKQPEREK